MSHHTIDPISAGRVLSVNVAAASRLKAGGRTVMSAIGKRAVVGPVGVAPLGLAGDEQADLSVHGGLNKAVYAYPAEHYPFWVQARRDALADQDSLLGPDAAELAPGGMGENLTLSGLLEMDLWIGDRLVLPGCELVVSEPRYPCFKFVAVMGFAAAAKAMAREANCGVYLRVSRPGTVEAGQAVTLVPGLRQTRLVDLFRLKMSARRGSD